MNQTDCVLAGPGPKASGEPPPGVGQPFDSPTCIESADILEVRNLTRYYHTGSAMVKAVDDISFSVEKAAFVAVTGRSGSGKTTLLHLIGGLDKPDSGDIRIAGTDITSLNEERMTIFRRRNIGVVFQFFNLVPYLSVRDNILLPVNLDGAAVDEEFYWDVISALGLENQLDKKPNCLSGGERQRTAIARAMLVKPMLILADEPTGNLDKKASDNIFGLLSLMRERFGQTIVMVTHDEGMAGQTDQIIRLEDGCVRGTRDGTAG